MKKKILKVAAGIGIVVAISLGTCFYAGSEVIVEPTPSPQPTVTSTVLIADKSFNQFRLEPIKEIKKKTAIEVVKTEEPKQYVYTTGYLNVRRSAGSDAEWVGVLPPYAKIEILSTENKWSKIKIKDKEYFVHADYTTATAPEDSKVIEVCQIEPNQSGAYFKTADGKEMDKITFTSEKKVTPSASGKAIAPPVSGEKAGTSLGTFKLTAYCANACCCGQWANGYTASGTKCTQGRTVACGSLPMGTKIVINGHTYTVEDTGVNGNHIDIFFNSHSEALQFGVQYATVYLAE